ncbi:MAG: RNA-binding protein [Methanosphaera sp. rholeuAM130]|nr:MAG: RNA-binding protein [Methanosphaera sp. rholeuAM130]
MMVNILSQICEENIIDLLNQEKRIDERSFDDYRDITINTDYITKAEGSAMVSIGATTAVAGVKASLTTPFSNSPDEGIIITNTELLAIASRNFEYGPPNKFAVEISRVVDRTIREAPVIDFKDLSIVDDSTCWKLHIDIYILDFDGNIMDTACLAAVCALLTTKLPRVTTVNGEVNVDYDNMVSLPVKNRSVLCSIAKLYGQLLVDPSAVEESLMDTSISIAFREDGSICAMQKCGLDVLTIEEVKKSINIAFNKSRELFSILDKIK